MGSFGQPEADVSVRRRDLVGPGLVLVVLSVVEGRSDAVKAEGHGIDPDSDVDMTLTGNQLHFGVCREEKSEHKDNEPLEGCGLPASHYPRGTARRAAPPSILRARAAHAALSEHFGPKGRRLLPEAARRHPEKWLWAARSRMDPQPLHRGVK